MPGVTGSSPVSSTTNYAKRRGRHPSPFWCVWGSIRRRTFALTVSSEVNYWAREDSSNPASETITAIRPGLVTLNELLFIESTPHLKGGPHWDTYVRYFGQHDARILVWQAPTRVMNPLIPESVVQDALERDPERGGEAGGPARRAGAAGRGHRSDGRGGTARVAGPRARRAGAADAPAGLRGGEGDARSAARATLLCRVGLPRAPAAPNGGPVDRRHHRRITARAAVKRGSTNRHLAPAGWPLVMAPGGVVRRLRHVQHRRLPPRPGMSHCGGLGSPVARAAERVTFNRMVGDSRGLQE